MNVRILARTQFANEAVYQTLALSNPILIFYDNYIPKRYLHSKSSSNSIFNGATLTLSTRFRILLAGLGYSLAPLSRSALTSWLHSGIRAGHCDYAQRDTSHWHYRAAACGLSSFLSLCAFCVHCCCAHILSRSKNTLVKYLWGYVRFGVCVSLSWEWEWAIDCLRENYFWVIECDFLVESECLSDWECDCVTDKDTRKIILLRIIYNPMNCLGVE